MYTYTYVSLKAGNTLEKVNLIVVALVILYITPSGQQVSHWHLLYLVIHYFLLSLRTLTCNTAGTMTLLSVEK